MSQLSITLCDVISWPWSQPWKVCGLCCSTQTTFNCYKTISVSLTNSTELQLAEKKSDKTNEFFNFFFFALQMLYSIRMPQNRFRIQQYCRLLSITGRTEGRKLGFGQLCSFNRSYCTRCVLVNPTERTSWKCFLLPSLKVLNNLY